MFCVEHNNLTNRDGKFLYGCIVEESFGPHTYKHNYTNSNRPTCK